MYVSKLHTDDDAGWQQYELDDPTWEQVAAAMRALDSSNKTLVMLEADEDHWLGIGGGDPEGHYFVTIIDDSISTYYLAITPDAPDAEIRLVVGGQAADYPARQRVDLATALRVAQIYYADGSLDPSVVWEET